MANFQILGLLIQTCGALVIGLLCLMLNRVVGSAALRSWVYGWCALAVALFSLLLEQVAPQTAQVALPCYLLGEYFFGYWIIRGCARFSERPWSRGDLSAWAIPMAVTALLLPVALGSEFRKLFIVQSTVLTLVFFFALRALQPTRPLQRHGSGLLFTRAALGLLTLTFACYPPIFLANIFLDWPLPMGVLVVSSGAHLLFEFLLGFGGAVMILERNNRDLTGQNSALHDEVDKYRGEAERDALTNALNRRVLVTRLEQILASAAITSKKVVLFYLDLDNFKEVNDARGHGFGDQVLIAVARRLQECVTPDDVVVRMGGDEFIVIAVSAQAPSAVAQLAERIARELSDPVRIAGISVMTRASIGICTYPEDGLSAEVLLQQADVALYQTKACGKNGYRHFDASMRQRDRERANLSAELIDALGTDQLFLDYQPILDLQTSSVVSLEALVRWHHPTRGLIAPNDFISLAEQGGYIHSLGEAVLHSVCRQLRSWQESFTPVVPVAVNVSSRQFERGGLGESFSRIIAEYAIDPVLIRIEITETELMRNVAEHSKTLNFLRDQGVKVCVDDFGTGYSSLSYLKNLPIDCIKIDRTFVMQMTTDDRDAAIVHGIIGIATSMDIFVVAEGVETEEQAKHLRTVGCSHAQGYFFHRPMSAERCQELLSAGPPPMSKQRLKSFAATRQSFGAA